MISAAQLKEDYLDKRMTMRDIADKHGVSLAGLHYIMNRHGITRRSPGRPKNLEPTARKSILRMRKAGYAIHWIADMLGINHNHVWRTLQAEGLVGSRTRPARYGKYRPSDAEPMVG